ncbi:ion channel [Phenylobacterium sp.]|uniref:ion channel n=1 Tax=Phenylobacterium sp. TaxID=1871053 RepID=UPI002E2FA11C|nr:ion channel [Phenylobacterium sp.]HEX4710135.1 ion channel [Phenylobacterium sp.]
MKLPPPRINLRGLQAVKVGVRRFSIDDPYYLVMAMRWPTFLASVLLAYLAANMLFATLFWLAPGSVHGARPGAFGDAFFFSVETLATVGYGAMTPATVYGHAVATAEIFVGMFLTALVTGAFFARFARPHARLVFSETAVVTPYENRYALMVRVASRRMQGISEARARMVYLRDEPVGTTRFRRFIELKLVRDNIPVLALSWTLIHPIDEDSPLFGMSDARLAAEAPTVLVSIVGFDEAISSPVNDRRSYNPENIRYDHVFSNILRDLPGGFIELDITRIHETMPIAGTDQDSAVSAS